MYIPHRRVPHLTYYVVDKMQVAYNNSSVQRHHPSLCLFFTSLLSARRHSQHTQRPYRLFNPVKERYKLSGHKTASKYDTAEKLLLLLYIHTSNFEVYTAVVVAFCRSLLSALLPCFFTAGFGVAFVQTRAPLVSSESVVSFFRSV